MPPLEVEFEILALSHILCLLNVFLITYNHMQSSPGILARTVELSVPPRFWPLLDRHILLFL